MGGFTAGEPPFLDHVVHHLLLVQVEAQGLASGFLGVGEVGDCLDVSLPSLVGELSVGLHLLPPNYYIMRRFTIKGQTGGKRDDSVDAQTTTITYYKLGREQPYLAIVRYTAYGVDGKALKVYEGRYEDDPLEFCRLENDIEVALRGGIDTSIQSAYDYEYFPVICGFID